VGSDGGDFVAADSCFFQQPVNGLAEMIGELPVQFCQGVSFRTPPRKDPRAEFTGQARRIGQAQSGQDIGRVGMKSDQRGIHAIATGAGDHADVERSLHSLLA
jgi:hypothetical protein